MNIYPVKSKKLSGTSYAEVMHAARRLFRDLGRLTKRKPYVRSAYFSKDQIFFDSFWRHLNQKSPRERRGRLVFLPCALELIEKSRQAPLSKLNPNRKREVLHRFAGVTKDNELFYIQIRDDGKTKQLMSVFSPK